MCMIGGETMGGKSVLYSLSKYPNEVSFIKEFAMHEGYSIVKEFNNSVDEDTFAEIADFMKTNKIYFLLVYDICRVPSKLLKQINILDYGFVGVVDTVNGIEYGLRDLVTIGAYGQVVNDLKRECYYKIEPKAGMKVAIYHMSLDPIRKGCIDVQMDIMRTFAANKKWEIAKEYIDLTNKPTEKEQWKQLMKDVKNFEVVIIKNAYFISRHVPEYVKARNELMKNGVALYSMTEGWC